MSILIDPPLWPAHGTLFSHLVSDRSLAELHDFADRTGVSPRAFDRDHYDVPAHRRAGLVAAGAQEVTAAELTRRLRASGLRIPARERPERIRAGLLRRWDAQFPDRSRRPAPEAATARAGEDGGLGERLVRAWESPGRHYHDTVHLLEVLDRVEKLAREATLDADWTRRVRLAAWFHDAVYAGRPGRDEQESADWCRAEFPDADGRAAAALILRTADHTAPGDTTPDDDSTAREAFETAWAVLHDADLGVLGADAGRYGRYAEAVRAEYAQVPEAEFARRRVQILRGLLDQPRLYLLPGARTRWEQRARENVSAEVRRLDQRARSASSAGAGTGSGPRSGRG